eukprot:Plantae.Rhodophyta-Rhodochaete_pulchella.ctg9765.p1 GENE.Plantae.Rhodophyta-Rhodochaete_pulchella.ctg9765~~Plantae.Rhodophyta-Rhodochaete_pulchella.ctg9765.p1  ORF type:complete len:209 (-),score=16.66 Plantae.Rhodophyta-Rhodochaete_pulchella.ctg9765:1513-2139(-)
MELTAPDELMMIVKNHRTLHKSPSAVSPLQPLGPSPMNPAIASEVAPYPSQGQSVHASIKGLSGEPGPLTAPTPATPSQDIRAMPRYCGCATNNTSDAPKKAASVLQNFPNYKFSGDFTQSIHTTIRDYKVCAAQLESETKNDFSGNLFAGPSRTFFFENVNEEMSFHETADGMMKDYDCDTSQLARSAFRLGRPANQQDYALKGHSR